MKKLLLLIVCSMACAPDEEECDWLDAICALSPEEIERKARIKEAERVLGIEHYSNGAVTIKDAQGARYVQQEQDVLLIAHAFGDWEMYERFRRLRAEAMQARKDSLTQLIDLHNDELRNEKLSLTEAKQKAEKYYDLAIKAVHDYRASDTLSFQGHQQMVELVKRYKSLEKQCHQKVAEREVRVACSESVIAKLQAEVATIDSQ